MPLLQNRSFCMCVRSRRVTTRWPQAPPSYDTLTGAVNEQKLRCCTFSEVFCVGNRGGQVIKVTVIYMLLKYNFGLHPAVKVV
jgi:hypothetical protein